MYKEIWVFGLAFAGGLVLDIFSVRVPGTTSIFLVIFLFLILLYQKKYEIDSLPFVIAATFAGSICFLSFFGYSSIMTAAILSALLGVVFYVIVKKFNRSTSKSGL